MSINIKGKVGRPKGSKEKSLSNKTRLFRDCFTEEDIKMIAHKIKGIIKDDELPISERKQYFDMALKYNLVDANTEYRSTVDLQISENEDTKLNREEVIKAISEFRTEWE